jgi:hypothetical protein
MLDPSPRSWMPDAGMQFDYQAEVRPKPGVAKQVAVRMALSKNRPDLSTNAKIRQKEKL